MTSLIPERSLKLRLISVDYLRLINLSSVSYGWRMIMCVCNVIRVNGPRDDDDDDLQGHPYGREEENQTGFHKVYSMT